MLSDIMSELSKLMSLLNSMGGVDTVGEWMAYVKFWHESHESNICMYGMDNVGPQSFSIFKNSIIYVLFLFIVLRMFLICIFLFLTFDFWFLVCFLLISYSN